MKRVSTIGLGLVCILVAFAGSAAAQGVLLTRSDNAAPLPRPGVEGTTAYKIKELAVHARLEDQVARVDVSQTFVNTGSRQLDVAFVFPLPYDGAIDRLTLMVDGKEYPAKLLPAKEARRIYEGYITRSKDPALLEWMGTGMFQTSVFPLPPGAARKVSLRYNQLLRKDHNLTDFLFPLSTAKYTAAPVEKIDIQVSIQSGVELKSVYSPTHSIEVKRPDAHHATVSLTRENQVPVNDFRLFFDVAKGKVGASLLSYRPSAEEDGYFLLLASPRAHLKSDERPAKNVVCVFDRSGSMDGDKIKQAREALKFVLNHLDDRDRFNIIAYDSEVEAFQPELQPYNEQSRKQALGFVEGLYASGGTNIDGALNKVFGMLKDTSRPNYVIFMTDGQPTVGETNESKIVLAAEKRNDVRARLVSFGVGYDVNSRLLDRLSRACFGQSAYVRPNEDIEEHVSRLYNKISNPVMIDVAVNYEFDELNAEDGSPVSRTYPKQLTDLFQGEQLVLVGRYKKTGAAKVKITGSIGDTRHAFDFPARMVETSDDESYGFVAKLWAMRRIGEIIDELDLIGQNQELIKELVSLSTRHGILTPYTSFLADDQGGLRELADARRGGQLSLERSTVALDRLNEADGQAAFVQRALKSRFQAAQQAFGGSAPAAAGEHPVDAAALGAAVVDLDRDEIVRTRNVRQIGNLTFYKRGDKWVSAEVAKQDLAKLKTNIKTIKRFSKEYFELVKKNSKDANAALSQQADGEELYLEVEGKPVVIK
jgi:Ca-activated chloride channel family protein